MYLNISNVCYLGTTYLEANPLLKRYAATTGLKGATAAEDT